jgi:hypothetical protein
VLASAAGARADDQPRAAEAPSPLLPVAGVALAGLAVYLNLHVTNELAAGDESCIHPGGGCFLTTLAASPIELAAGGLLGYWGWRLGEHQAWLDHKEGRPPADTKALRTAGLVVGGAAILANVGINEYELFKTLSCHATTSPEVASCFGGSLKTLGYVQTGAAALLVLAVPAVGYGLGYDHFGAERAPSATLVPTLLPGGGGLALVAAF